MSTPVVQTSHVLDPNTLNWSNKPLQSAEDAKIPKATFLGSLLQSQIFPAGTPKVSDRFLAGMNPNGGGGGAGLKYQAQIDEMQRQLNARQYT